MGYNLRELVDLALCIPEVGAVNFNILRTLLLNILDYTGIGDAAVLKGANSEMSVLDPGTNFQIMEKSELAEKIEKIEAFLECAFRGGEPTDVSSKSDLVFRRLPSKIPRPVQSLPSCTPFLKTSAQVNQSQTHLQDPRQQQQSQGVYGQSSQASINSQIPQNVKQQKIKTNDHVSYRGQTPNIAQQQPRNQMFSNESQTPVQGTQSQVYPQQLSQKQQTENQIPSQSQPVQSTTRPTSGTQSQYPQDSQKYAGSQMPSSQAQSTSRPTTGTQSQSQSYPQQQQSSNYASRESPVQQPQPQRLLSPTSNSSRQQLSPISQSQGLPQQQPQQYNNRVQNQPSSKFTENSQQQYQTVQTPYTDSQTSFSGESQQQQLQPGQSQSQMKSSQLPQTQSNSGSMSSQYEPSSKSNSTLYSEQLKSQAQTDSHPYVQNSQSQAIQSQSQPQFQSDTSETQSLSSNASNVQSSRVSPSNTSYQSHYNQQPTQPQEQQSGYYEYNQPPSTNQSQQQLQPKESQKVVAEPQRTQTSNQSRQNETLQRTQQQQPSLSQQQQPSYSQQQSTAIPIRSNQQFQSEPLPSYNNQSQQSQPQESQGIFNENNASTASSQPNFGINSQRSSMLKINSPPQEQHPLYVSTIPTPSKNEFMPKFDPNYEVTSSVTNSVYPGQSQNEMSDDESYIIPQSYQQQSQQQLSQTQLPYSSQSNQNQSQIPANSGENTVQPQTQSQYSRPQQFPQQTSQSSSRPSIISQQQESIQSFQPSQAPQTGEYQNFQQPISQSSRNLPQSQSYQQQNQNFQPNQVQNIQENSSRQQIPQSYDEVVGSRSVHFGQDNDSVQNAPEPETQILYSSNSNSNSARAGRDQMGRRNEQQQQQQLSRPGSPGRPEKLLSRSTTSITRVNTQTSEPYAAIKAIESQATYEDRVQRLESIKNLQTPRMPSQQSLQPSPDITNLVNDLNVRVSNLENNVQDLAHINQELIQENNDIKMNLMRHEMTTQTNVVKITEIFHELDHDHELIQKIDDILKDQHDNQLKALAPETQIIYQHSLGPGEQVLKQQGNYVPPQIPETSSALPSVQYPQKPGPEQPSVMEQQPGVSKSPERKSSTVQSPPQSRHLLPQPSQIQSEGPSNTIPSFPEQKTSLTNTPSGTSQGSKLSQKTLRRPSLFGQEIPEEPEKSTGTGPTAEPEPVQSAVPSIPNLDELKEEISRTNSMPSVFDEMDVLVKIATLWEAFQALRNNEENLAVQIIGLDAKQNKATRDIMEALEDTQKNLGKSINDLSEATASNKTPSFSLRSTSTIFENQNGEPGIISDEIYNALTDIIADHNGTKHRVDGITDVLRTFETLMITKPQMIEAMRDKADRGELKTKVSYDEFGKSINDLTTRMQNLIREIFQKNENLNDVNEQLAEELSKKLDKSELTPLRRFIKCNFKDLEGKVHQLMMINEEPDPCGTRKKILRDYNCISCDRHCNISGVTNTSTLPLFPPISRKIPQSNAANIAYDVQRMRTKNCGNPDTRDFNMMAKQYKANKGQSFEVDFACGDQTYSPDIGDLVNRYAGGSHTQVTQSARVRTLRRKQLDMSQMGQDTGSRHPSRCCTANDNPFKIRGNQVPRSYHYSH